MAFSLTTDKKRLTRLAATLRKAPFNMHLPVLQGFLLESCESALHITATDGGSWLRLELPGHGAIPAMLLPREDLLGALKGAGRLEIRDDGSIVTDLGVVSTNPMALESFPEWPKAQSCPALELRIEENLEWVMQAISRDDTKPTMSSVLVDASDPDQTHLVGTDGFRLAVASISHAPRQEPCPRILLSRHMLPLLGSLLKGGDKRVKLTPLSAEGLATLEDPVRLLIEGDGWTLQEHLTQGNYPAWRKVVPTKSGEPLTIPVKPFKAAVEVVARKADPYNRKCQFLFAEGVVLARLKHPENGEAYATAPFQGKALPDGLHLAFEDRFMLDLAKSAGEGPIHLWPNPAGAVVFEAPAMEGWSRQLYLMPILFSSENADHAGLRRKHPAFSHLPEEPVGIQSGAA